MISSKQMTSEQQAKILRLTKLGLSWITDELSLEEVTKQIGKSPVKSDVEGSTFIDYTYFLDGITLDFYFNKPHRVGEMARVDSFGLEIAEDQHTNISYDKFDDLGLKRVIRGQSIDGVRVEPNDFFFPAGIANVYGSIPKNYATFNYRFPMPVDSIFEVTARFGYLGEWKDERGGWTIDNFRQATDLRRLGIHRTYLSHDELNRRSQSRHHMD